MANLSHTDPSGKARMVDVAGKASQLRTATAEGERNPRLGAQDLESLGLAMGIAGFSAPLLIVHGPCRLRSKFRPICIIFVEL